MNLPLAINRKGFGNKPKGFIAARGFKKLALKVNFVKKIN